MNLPSLDEIEDSAQVVYRAMRDIFACTHNVAEGAGAASFAAAMWTARCSPTYYKIYSAIPSIYKGYSRI